MNGIFNGRITEAFCPEWFHIAGLNFMRRQRQLFNKCQCRPQSSADRGVAPVF